MNVRDAARTLPRYSPNRSPIVNAPNNNSNRTNNAPAPRESSNAVAWQSLRKSWPTALVTFLTVLVANVFYTVGQKKIYEAEATVMFDPNPPRPLGARVEQVVEMGAQTYWDNQEYYETQYFIIKSRRVALAVVNELGLDKDHRFLSNLPTGGTLKEGTSKSVSPERAAEMLRGRIKVQPVRDSRLAVIKLRDANPQRAQRILASLIDIYVTQNLTAAQQSTSSATDWLRGQLDTLKGDLEASEKAMHKYKRDNDILSVAFDDKSSMLVAQMNTVNHQLTLVRARIQEAAARRSVLAGVPDTDPSTIESTELLNSTLLTSLRGTYERALRNRDALLGQGKGAKHPDVMAAGERVRRARKAILKEIHNVKRASSRDVSVLARHAGGLRAMLKKSKKQAHRLNLLEIEYNRLSRSKNNTEKLYSLVLERTKEADLAQMLRVNNISVVDRPLLPQAAVFPRVPLNIAVGVFAGLMLGIAAAFLRGLMDRTVKVPDDLENELGLTFLGLLPELNEKALRTSYGNKRRRGKRVDPSKSELTVHHAPTSSIAEAARAVRTNLMFRAPDNPYRTLLVTSAGPAEGKTTVACCIAIAMAQAGQDVAIIDCDLRRPRLHRVFGKSSATGVTTSILDGDFEATIHPTDVPNLSVITSGPIPPNPAELFHTSRFKAMLEQATKRFDRVIIDSPPIAAVTDPAIISTLVDSTVLVVRAYATRKELVRHAARSIHDVGGSLAGAVLNAVDFSRHEYKYSYYYYRRDGYSYKSRSEDLEQRLQDLPNDDHPHRRDEPQDSAGA